MTPFVMNASQLSENESNDMYDIQMPYDEWWVPKSVYLDPLIYIS
jgi:hypothetical protein